MGTGSAGGLVSFFASAGGAGASISATAVGGSGAASVFPSAGDSGLGDGSRPGCRSSPFGAGGLGGGMSAKNTVIWFVRRTTKSVESRWTSVVAMSCSGLPPAAPPPTVGAGLPASGPPGPATHTQMSLLRRLKLLAASTNAASSCSLNRSSTRPPLLTFSWSRAFAHCATLVRGWPVSGSRSVCSRRPGPLTASVLARLPSAPGGGSVSVTTAAVAGSPAERRTPFCFTHTGVSAVPRSTVVVGLPAPPRVCRSSTHAASSPSA